ncbi:group 1 truncated hemoglobin [Nocardia sp. 2]|uniref:Group 1 truncated hemoglobin n=1 Tax=Nocardia acididurans TaxID=2802282 RepID=A0ABS1LZT7_9NOCA|nr:group 1 truncated hemoglobin [Nocardia acididurans]MBL1073927.1 group 1 truncated hemoglobin [Nocardia acididurans]
MSSIYAQIGGGPAVTEVVEDFYRRVLADGELAEFFAGSDGERVKRLQVEFFSKVLGGPAVYTGAPLRRVCEDRDITRAHFDRTARHLAGALESAGVRPEFATRILTVAEMLAIGMMAVGLMALETEAGAPAGV